MTRVLKNRELINTRLLHNYGGWIYCSGCNKNIGNLCYATYDRMKLVYECNCGFKGALFIDFEDSKPGEVCEQDLVVIRNRFCCPADESPFLTMLSKNVKNFEFEATCNACGKIYKKKS